MEWFTVGVTTSAPHLILLWGILFQPIRVCVISAFIMKVNNDYEERLIWCVKQLRHNIQQVTQKDETYKRKPGKPIKHSIYEKKTENLRSTFTHTSWSAHVTPLACNCIAVRVFFYQMTGLNELKFTQYLFIF